jgi:hypothetical protein
MKVRSLTIVLVVAAAARVPAQELPPPQTVMEAQEDLNYAELLNAAQFTPEQLDALLDIQAALEAGSVLGPDEAAALAEVRHGVLRGLTSEEAMRALGERAPVFGQAHARFGELVQAQSKALTGLLTEDQKTALAWAATPARGLANVVDNVGQARAVPDAQWQQVRTDMVQALVGMSTVIDPAAKVTAEQIGALLDGVRAMDDETLKARRASIAKEWAQTLMPSILQRLTDPKSRDQQIDGVIHQILTYRRGQQLVRAKQEAMVAR